MNNLKSDILDKIARDRKYLELELAGLGQNITIGYRKKIKKMKKILNKIAIANGTFGLLDVYFPEPNVEEPVAQEPVAQEPDDIAKAPVEEEAKVSNSPFPKINTEDE